MIGLPPQPSAASNAPSSPPRSREAMEGRIGNAFACERCRKHKVRCVPSDTAGLCQRCQKARVECIEHVARRRPARPRPVVQTPTRVSEMEKKTETLSAIVTATSAPASAPQPTLPPVSTLPSQSHEVVHRTPTPAPLALAPPVAPVAKPPVLANPGPISESALSFWEHINDTISALGRLDPVLKSISVIHMQMLLESYRAMVDYFPFVTLPKDSHCRDLIRQRPILMFAVLTVASYDSALLQLALSREFRKLVTMKIMTGEKSLDLLQGLLVFIAWHHHYTDQQAISIHMLLQMCFGIAGDLGLNRLSATYQVDDPHDREAKRAYLGCYYLSTNLALMEAGRARSVAYTAALKRHANELAHARDSRSDQALPAFVDTCQFLEDVEETFHNHSGEALVARSQVKRLADKWDTLRIASKQLTSDFKTLNWLQLAARVYLYKSALTLELPDKESMPWASGFQLSLRITCLRTVEQFLENSVQLASSDYESLSIVDWLNLISTLTSLGKLTLHSPPIQGWDPVDLQLAKTFEYFRDQLSAQLPKRDNQERKAEDVFDRFRRVTAIMKMALRSAPGRGSPNGSTFEITTSSRQTVSLLQDLPPPKPNGMTNGDLPAPWKVSPTFDMSSNEFPWKFLMGTV